MKSTRPRVSAPASWAAVFIILFLVVTVAFFLAPGYRDSSPNLPTPPEIHSSNATHSSPAREAEPGVSVVPKVAGDPGFQMRPFAVTYESGTEQWTAEDGKDTNVIRKLAHNKAEYERMVAENDRIKRRQLVYRKETVPMLLQQALSGHEQLRSFILPGLDGLEVEIEVTETQVNGLAQSGSVTGRVKNRFNSLATVGFANGYESFNILSPDDGLYLTADAREPGQVIVKEIDPNVYGATPETDTPDFIVNTNSTTAAANNMQELMSRSGSSK